MVKKHILSEKKLWWCFAFIVLGAILLFIHFIYLFFQLPDWIKIGDLTSKNRHLFVNLQSKGLQGGGKTLTLPGDWAVLSWTETVVYKWNQSLWHWGVRGLSGPEEGAAGGAAESRSIGGASLWDSTGLVWVDSCAKMKQINVWWWFCSLSTDLFFLLSGFFFYSVHLRNYFPCPHSPYTFLSPFWRWPGQSGLRISSLERLRSVWTRQPGRPWLCWMSEQPGHQLTLGIFKCHHQHHYLWLMSEQQSTIYLLQVFWKIATRPPTPCSLLLN